MKEINEEKLLLDICRKKHVEIEDYRYIVNECTAYEFKTSEDMTKVLPTFIKKLHKADIPYSIHIYNDDTPILEIGVI